VRRELDSLVTQMHSSGIPYEDAVRDFKRQYLREVLVAHRGNQCKAAEELGNAPQHVEPRHGGARAGSRRSARWAQASAAQRTSCVSTARQDITAKADGYFLKGYADYSSHQRSARRELSRTLPGTSRTPICSISTARCCAAATASTSIPLPPACSG
jgi:hypothetical protein